jgi:hypothetical protein
MLRVIAAPAGGRRWYQFSGQGAPGRDHDQFPVTGADREGRGVSFLQNAQHVRYLLTVTRSWTAPPDHDPLSDVCGGKPDDQPVAHAGHLLAGGVAQAAGDRAAAGGAVLGYLALRRGITGR